MAKKKKKADATDDALTDLRKAIAAEAEGSVHDGLMALYAALTNDEIGGESDFVKPHLVNIRSAIESYIQARAQELA